MRDWSHIDYFGMPVTDEPKNIPALINVLQDEFRILRIQCFRHPIDTWLSLRRLILMKKADATPNQFAQAYLTYLEKTAGEYRLLYENFLAQPDQELQNICATLELEFDENYQSKWYEFKNITGDISNSTSLRKKNIIQPRTRKAVSYTHLTLPTTPYV